MNSTNVLLVTLLVWTQLVLFPAPGVAVEREWIRRHESPVNGSDWASDHAVDGDGNVYVTGASLDGTRLNFATVKFDADGNQVWAARYSRPGGRREAAVAVAVDSMGNIYVTGWTLVARLKEITTVKYDADGEELWVANVSGEALDQDGGNAEPIDLVVDPGGNAYVTGWIEKPADTDIVTVAYSSEGQQLWTAVFDREDGSDDRAAALALGEENTVCVTGTAAQDYVTLKYDAGGQRLWARTYDGPSSGIDEAAALQVGPGGFVYVTGRSGGAEMRFDYATVKYDREGTELWAARYDGPARGDDLSRAIAVDEEGFVYVTGSSHGTDRTETGRDYATVKYDRDGTKLWVARYDGAASDRDEAHAVAVNAAGRVHVTGISAAPGTVEYVTVIYDPDGRKLSVDRFDYAGPAGLEEEVVALALTKTGTILVTGTAVGVWSGPDYITIQYASGGQRNWVARYDGVTTTSDEGRFVAVDSEGNVYAIGTARRPNGSRDYLTVKYDPNGSPLWTARYDGRIEGSDTVTAATLDGTGNLYVTGSSSGRTDSDYATVKYDPMGSVLWAARYDGPFHGHDKAHGITVDAAGNVYVTGSSGNCRAGTQCRLGSDTLRDYATVKYDSDGNELWVARHDGLSRGWDGGVAVAVDSDGFVYVTGDTEGPRGPDRREAHDYTTIQYDPDGNEVWVASFDGPGEGFDRATALVLLEDSLVVTGTSAGTVGREEADDLATVKYNFDGHELWVARFDGSAGSTDRAVGVVADGDGNVYVAGTVTNTDTGEDYIVLKYDEDGQELWARSYDGPISGADSAMSLAVDARGRIAVTGYSSGIPTAQHGVGRDYATILYDGSGNELWAGRYDGPAHREDVAFDVTFDRQGDLYITGSSNESLVTVMTTIKYDFDPQVVVPFRRGDANADGELNLTDPLFTLAALFGGRVAALSCRKSGDSNDDGSLDLADSVYLLALLFQGGEATPEPALECGPDPTPDELSCLAFEGCE